MPHRAGGIIALAFATLVSARTASITAAEADDRMTSSLVRVIDALPYYGVFDLLVFTVNHGTVTLEGSVYHAGLATGAVMAVERVNGVNRVVNKVQPLPTSAQDDWIRWAVFTRVYTDDFRSRYAEHGRFRIHILVKNGRVSLIGAVETEGDRQEAALRARAVIGTFAVYNELIVEER